MAYACEWIFCCLAGYKNTQITQMSALNYLGEGQGIIFYDISDMLALSLSL